VCKDRGLLPDTHVDIFWNSPDDGWQWQGAVGSRGTIEIVEPCILNAQATDLPPCSPPPTPPAPAMPPAPPPETPPAPPPAAAGDLP
jgi:hypothetical protein